MKDAIYVSKNKRTAIRISKIIHCGLIHNSLLKKQSNSGDIEKDDILSKENLVEPDCIFVNMEGGLNIAIYCDNSKDAKEEFYKIVNLMNQNNV